VVESDPHAATLDRFWLAPPTDRCASSRGNVDARRIGDRELNEVEIQARSLKFRRLNRADLRLAREAAQDLAEF
jgi:hypothetical protein